MLEQCFRLDDELYAVGTGEQRLLLAVLEEVLHPSFHCRNTSLTFFLRRDKTLVSESIVSKNPAVLRRLFA